VSTHQNSFVLLYMFLYLFMSEHGRPHTSMSMSDFALQASSQARNGDGAGEGRVRRKGEGL